MSLIYNVWLKCLQKEKKTVNKKKKTFCPHCGSEDISWASGLPHLGSLYDCRDCGYHGSLIVEDGQLASKTREEFLKNKEHEE